MGTLESSGTESMFSWELRGSTASLLGTGVMFEGRLAKDSEFDFVVVSWRHDDDGTRGVGVALVAGVEPLGLAGVDALAKKPRILCCFPVEDGSVLLLLLKLLLFFTVDGVLAGVRAGALDLSPIFRDNETTDSRSQETRIQTQTPAETTTPEEEK